MTHEEAKVLGATHYADLKGGDFEYFIVKSKTEIFVWDESWVKLMCFQCKEILDLIKPLS